MSGEKRAKETPEAMDRRLALERQCAAIAGAIRDSLPRGHGFVLLTFDFGEGGNLAYMSSGDRTDVIRAMREFIERESRRS